MPRVLGMLVLFLLLVPMPARAGDLTLRDLVELHRAGLGDELLVAASRPTAGRSVSPTPRSWTSRRRGSASA